MLAGVLSACGSTYSKRDFAHRADAICASELRDLRALAPPNFGGPALHVRRALAAYSASVLRIVQSEASQLRALPRPSESSHETAVLHGYLRALDRAVADYRRLAGAQLAGNTAATSAAEAALAADPVGRLAASYGLGSCSSPGATYS
jgi:hypothetical protein